MTAIENFVARADELFKESKVNSQPTSYKVGVRNQMWFIMFWLFDIP